MLRVQIFGFRVHQASNKPRAEEFGVWYVPDMDFKQEALLIDT